MLRYDDHSEEKLLNRRFNCGKSCRFSLVKKSSQCPQVFKTTFGLENCPTFRQYFRAQIV